MDVKPLNSGSRESDAVIASIVEESGVDPKDCYQCGKCSAGCPVASYASKTPREIIRSLQLGQLDPVLASDMAWLCVGCNMCVTRCPQDVDLPSLMAAIRREGARLGSVAVSEVGKFSDIFLDNVRRLGVSDETLLAARFNVTTGHLFQDALNAPRMMKRGMIGHAGHEVEGAQEVRRIIDSVRLSDAEKWAARMDEALGADARGSQSDEPFDALREDAAFEKIEEGGAR